MKISNYFILILLLGAGLCFSTPVISIISPENTTYSSGTWLNISATDDNLDTVWWFNGYENVTYTEPIFIDYLPDGFYFLTVWANDTDNNVSEETIYFTINTQLIYFITEWDTSLDTGHLGNTYVTLPLVSTGTYGFTVDWGDGNVSYIDAYDGTYVNNSHDYGTQGTYEIKINGTLTGWAFGGGGDALKFIEISQWGTSL